MVTGQAPVCTGLRHSADCSGRVTSHGGFSGAGIRVGCGARGMGVSHGTGDGQEQLEPRGGRAGKGRRGHRDGRRRWVPGDQAVRTH